MRFCKKCGKKMKATLHFESGKSWSYYWCDSCKEDTKPKRIIYADDLRNNQKGVVLW